MSMLKWFSEHSKIVSVRRKRYGETVMEIIENEMRILKHVDTNGKDRKA